MRAMGAGLARGATRVATKAPSIGRQASTNDVLAAAVESVLVTVVSKENSVWSLHATALPKMSCWEREWIT